MKVRVQLRPLQRRIDLLVVVAHSVRGDTSRQWKFWALQHCG